MATAFVRQLGSQPGAQLNPIRDRTDGAALGVFDQVAALVGRFQRGRIDKPFRVNMRTLRQSLGKPASISLSGLNEAYVHGYEALQRGARELVVQRLNVSAAAISWVVFQSAATSTFSVQSTVPGSGYTFAVRHLGCHNDGIQVKVHADTYAPSGTALANAVVTVKIIDADGLELFSIKGSLDSAAVDEFGESLYLPDVSASVTDLLEWNIASAQAIGTTHDGYGKDSAGKDKFAASTVLVAFSEGGTAYSTSDYDRCMTALRTSQEDFGYILGGGTRAVALITRMADLAFDTNRQFVFDVGGDLAPNAAIAFVKSLGFGTLGRDHYPQVYWAPLRSLDPVNGNKVVFGTSGAQVGYRCARNSVKNAYGLAAKNVPVAGINGNLGRANVTQLYSPSEAELSDLADAKINPVLFQTYSGGSRPVFTDCLTCAATVLSYRKLIPVAEMSAHLDESVCRFGREVIMLPMETAIARMQDYLERLFNNALGSAWLVDSDEVPAFQYAVQRHPDSPADKMLVEYWLHYDGVARQVYVQQSIV